MTVVFVGGVHGVGKSTCCAGVARATGCLHVTASEIIRRERAGAIAASGKLVADVEGNQDLLIRGFRTLQSEAGAASILLDGHFAVRDGQGHIQPVSVEVFSALGIGYLVCLADEPNLIAVRIAQRDGYTPVERDIGDLQDAELKNAKLVATTLGLPFASLRSGDIEALSRLVLPV
jgi:adenylate kinase